MGNEHQHQHAPWTTDNILAQIEAMIKFCPQCRGTLTKKPVPPESKLQLACDECTFIFYLNPKVVACCVPQLNGKVLLLRRNIEPSLGKWTYPGGFVDLGESVQDAARRETLEEVNVQVELTSLLDVYSYANTPVVIVVYLANVIAGEVKVGIEAQEARFFAPREIPWDDLAFRSTKEALEAWIRTLKAPIRA
jgi:ADP-ribose pyrophosphatase YjhB (NUDIX family)